MDVGYSLITIMQSDGKLGLTVGIGGNVANTEPEKWGNKKETPQEFINWVKELVSDSEYFPDRVLVSGA